MTRKLLLVVAGLVLLVVPVVGQIHIERGLNTLSGILTTSVDGIASTSSDGMILQNSTAATAGTTVQMSPRQKWCGTAWDTAASQTVCFFAETLPATAATPTGTWKLGYSLNGAAPSYPMTVSSAGVVTATSLAPQSSTINGASAAFYWLGRTMLRSNADGTLQVTNNAQSAGVGLDVATDNIFKVRTRAQTGDAAVSASIYSSSASSVLTVSSNIIAPTGSVHHVGAGLIKTITVPTTCTPTCVIHLIPDAAFTYDATGNLVVPSGGGTAVINRMMILAWDGTKWTPSY